MSYYFSPSSGGFYNDDVHGAVIHRHLEQLEDEDKVTEEIVRSSSIPSDAIEISHEHWRALLEGQGQGLKIGLDNKGNVALIPA